jgi:RimJ/RimL family protein N-acetyltransferase
MLNDQKAQTLPGLHCKPVLTNEILYSKQVPQGLLTLRSLNLSTDLDVVYGWVNQSYSRRFWQMNGSRELLQNTYSMILRNPHAHSFMALLDDSPVGQIDIYQVLSDELASHIDAMCNDCGIHLLMLPPNQSKKGLSLELLRAFITYYFSFPQSGSLYAEPDVENESANLLATRAGFKQLKEVTLSSKTANLYHLSL